MMQAQETNFEKSREDIKRHIKNIKKILEKIDVPNKNKIDVLNESGSVFFSGYGTLLKPNGVYLIGINPGGDPKEIKTTAADSLDGLLKKMDEDQREEIKLYYHAYDNAYLDEYWGKGNFQNNAKEAFEELKLCLRKTCISNIIFQRTKSKNDIYAIETTRNAYVQCHDYIINEIIKPSVIIAVGNDPYYALKENWCDEKGDNPLKKENGEPVPVSPYVETEDKILCYMPHFSSPWYTKNFSKCESTKKIMHDKIQEKLKKRNASNLPQWKFKNS